MTTPFQKMNGLGNDFVILDFSSQRGEGLALHLTEPRIRAIADREKGIGCDQLIVMEAPQHKNADVFMRIYNADGSEVAACGNATRCVAWLEMEARGTDTITIETLAGLLHCKRQGEQISVNMGRPRLHWDEIPVRDACDTLHMPFTMPPLADPVGVNVGNPHAVFFVDSLEKTDLATLGPKIEQHPFFPERVNVSIAHVEGKTTIHLRVWERGAGLTKACGTAACATMVAARLRGLVEEKAAVHLPGGILNLRWDGSKADPAHDIWMTGPVHHDFSGTL